MAGFRGVLDATGVTVGGAVPVASTPGITVLQAQGVWITGAVPVVVVDTPGFTINRLSGVWVDGSAQIEVVAPPVVGGGPDAPTKVYVPSSRPQWMYDKDNIERIMMEDDEMLLAIIMDIHAPFR